MLVSAPWYGTTSLLWPAIGPVVSLVVGSAAVVVVYFPARGRFLYSITRADQLFRGSPEIPDLQVVYKSEQMKDPYLVQIRLASRGRQDIEFHRDQPAILDMGAEIKDILDLDFSDGSPPLDVTKEGSKLKVGPEPAHLIKRRETIVIVVLTNGYPGQLRAWLPFKDAISRHYPISDRPRWLKRIDIIFLINYLALLIVTVLRQTAIVKPVTQLLEYSLYSGFFLLTILHVSLWVRRKLDELLMREVHPFKEIAEHRDQTNSQVKQSRAGGPECLMKRFQSTPS